MVRIQGLLGYCLVPLDAAHLSGVILVLPLFLFKKQLLDACCPTLLPPSLARFPVCVVVPICVALVSGKNCPTFLVPAFWPSSFFVLLPPSPFSLLPSPKSTTTVSPLRVPFFCCFWGYAKPFSWSWKFGFFFGGGFFSPPDFH